MGRSKLLYRLLISATVQDRARIHHDALEADVVETTGPWMLTDALKEYLPIRGTRSAGEYIHGPTNTNNGQGPADGLKEVQLPDLNPFEFSGKST